MDTARNYGTAPVAQWIRRLPTEQEILGSIPGGGIPTSQIFFFLIHLQPATVILVTGRVLRVDRYPTSSKALS